MNPPARLSDHSTARTLVTLAGRVRPRTSKRIVSPRPIFESFAYALLDRHLAGVRWRVIPQRAGDHAFVWFKRLPIRDGVLAGQRSTTSDILEVLESLEYGTPPHGGLALGLDRICALLAGEISIREVIPFPKTTQAVDLMCDAPSTVDPRQMRELHIKPIAQLGCLEAADVTQMTETGSRLA